MNKYASVFHFFSLFLIINLIYPSVSLGGHSVARSWNEVALEAIRKDFARPVVHARNLFHLSVAMYDAWAFYDSVSTPYLTGRIAECSFQKVDFEGEKESAQIEAISFAAYRLLSHRFSQSPNVIQTITSFDSLFSSLGFDKNFVSIDYRNASPAALGNYIGNCLIEYGFGDGSNELGNYKNQDYKTANSSIRPDISGNRTLSDPNRWQPIQLDVFIDQSGNIIPDGVSDFIGAEWGNVVPFSLEKESRESRSRDGTEYMLYHDPGPPPFLDALDPDVSNEYKWNFITVIKWSAHLDPTDNIFWDISPAGLGNADAFTLENDYLKSFYRTEYGGQNNIGYKNNPVTGMPYEQQLVPRGDYVRVLAEFWADGPASETPPGHWFVMLNYVSDRPELIKQWGGRGRILDDLEWDIKSYFTLGGALHDAAVAAWSIKGWYDYVRPISAIRALAGVGQSSDPNLPNYSVNGLPLVPGSIELISATDSLAGNNGEHEGKVKIRSWRGPDYVVEPSRIPAGVGWIRADDWWPYQRASFVTPPFAGYVSGHSTFSRAAAEILRLITGDPYFPGGIGQFKAEKDRFLSFEAGPSVDVVLQWATYKDAADQCGLSRIWGGIHPPIDDIEGRHLGEKIGTKAFSYAERFINGNSPLLSVSNSVDPVIEVIVFPNPSHRIRQVEWRVRPAFASNGAFLEVYNLLGQLLHTDLPNNRGGGTLDYIPESAGIYIVRVRGIGWERTRKWTLLR